MKTVAAKLLACALLLLFGAGFSLAQNGQLDFSLVNKTGVDIDEVNVSPAKSNDWGPDILGQDVLENGLIDLEVFKAALRPDTILVSVMFVTSTLRISGG